MPLLVLTPLCWTAEAPAALEPALAAVRRRALRRRLADEPVLALLPQAAHAASGQAPAEEVLLAQVGALAKATRLCLAGSAPVQEARRGVPCLLAFLVSASGEVLLRTPKITPELVNGFDALAAALGTEAAFAVAKTPFGQIGLLPGEDILFAPFARALVFHGAELILNPAEERADEHFEIRQCARLARAGENSCYVATASPARVTDGGATLALPPATALYGFDGRRSGALGGEDAVYIELELELLRQGRVNPHRSLPALVRANLYGVGYARAVSAAGFRRVGSAALGGAGGNGGEAAPRTIADWRREAERRLLAEAAARASHGIRYEERYEALLVQTCARLIPLDRGVDARAIMQKNLDAALALAGSRANVPSVRLVVFPEFWLTGPGGIGGVQRTVQDMERLAIRYPDPIFERIAEFARRNRVYVAFQNFEVHAKLPHRVFNSAFLIDDGGNLVHTYRKNQCADVWGLLPDTTPGSVLSQYLHIFGEDSLFPVADTPLGRLANMICFDNMVPEVAQGLRRAGAEIILHSSSEPHGGAGREVWDAARRLRAYENTCYLLSAIDGGEHLAHDSDVLTFFRRGHSRIVRFDGRVEGTVDGPGPVAFRVNVDLGALRRARANPFVNLGLWDDPAVYARHYSADVGLPNDLWAKDPLFNPYEGARCLKERIESYLARGIYVAPEHAQARASLPDSV